MIGALSAVNWFKNGERIEMGKNREKIEMGKNGIDDRVASRV